MFIDAINTSISYHFLAVSHSIRPGLPSSMIFATAADVLAAGAAYSYENRRYITTFGAIAVAGWVCSNVIPVTTARAAAESDSDSDDDEDDAAQEEQQDELVAMEEAVPNNARKPRRKYSIAHDDYVSGRVVNFDTDVEDINANDLVQLSCVASDQNGNILGKFDQFIKPPDDAEWDPIKCDVHKYTKDDERVVNGKSIKEVWLDYVKFVESHLDNGAKVGMIRGWNGKGCEMTKFFKICFVHYRGELHMPRWVEYFCDPMLCIRDHIGCKLHETKRTSRRQGYALGTVFEEAFKHPLHKAHDALFDCDGQLKICLHPHVKDYLDKVNSVQSINDVWKGKRARQAVMEEEPTRALPLGWEDSPATTYPIPSDLQYTGANGGGVCGPSSRVTEACNNRDLSELFLFYFTIPMLSSIAEEMDWKDITDDSQRPPYMRKRFLPCNCKICFCCKMKLTTRYGPPVRQSPRKRATPSRFVTPSRSSPPTLRKKARKGRVVEVEANHVKDRVAIFDSQRCCGVCLEENRRQKPKGVDRSETPEKFMNKSALGCPHIHCRGHPVCEEHWKNYKHKTIKFS